MALNDKQLALLNFIEQEFLLHGAVPTAAKCASTGLCTEKNYSTWFANAAFRAAIEERGVPLYNLGDPTSGTYVLTPEQLVAANVMLDLRDNRSQKKKLQDLGVPSNRWEAWLRDPAFQHYIRSRAENILGDNLHESHLALVDRVRSGDVSAIKYFNEITGRYVPASNGQVDISAVLMRVLEIIQKHVLNPAQQAAIADELINLSQELGVTSRGGSGPRPIAGTRVIESLSPPVGELSVGSI